MKLRLPYLLLIGLLLVAFSLARIYSRGQMDAEKNDFIMGTPVRVKVHGPNAHRLVTLAFNEIKRFDRLLSTFKPESEVSLLNKGAGLELSPETAECLKLADEIFRLSGGAFNIRHSGKIDLGGIGKGFAVEKARQLIMKSGAESGIIDMRSSIAVFGDRTWTVGVRHPLDKDKILGTIELKDEESLSTSGNYERGQHIIDPRKGRPADLCQSVTVVGTNAATVDALSTAIFVLGPQHGLNVRALIVDKEGQIIDDNSGVKLR
ncbi:hypothetical protein A3H38_05920 [candidate division WOR-1 bacterium RIFCSPLOWO2_02_FULL_46_20]|uniref:FAD:protein FMN transferase n=2 Tax=Saganbacteria TaxID=1703751 RepID=A0A1F4RBE3_UNCSA|nr:MAG: hypothetical protein A3J44_04450 [candidate division WOR-1 bacterium RIFCSPHIGHO2_02_FULL_45_12]OGC05499.1 MAG: hypothetical protein A3H38_05920 [candidate division WOR-1 bacterium RIFCSPLOWO2_02_FULL_46_20]OGC08129.1 MAG: hypothetical protein A3F86_01020 [candidate division WOR-1 bacterium RIFCSPLOWO2_12_FULL_45_9]